MDRYKFITNLNFIKRLIFLLTINFVISHSFAAYLPLEIIQPQPNLDTKNRFYKAYPGLEYNVRLSVAGGAYPFQYSLVTAPQGMTIDNRGEISWPNPIESGSPYSVAANVIDSEGGSRSVAWTITVTKQGFLFVDAVNGKTAAQGGTGTIEDPWKTMKDVYGGDVYDSKWSNHHPGSFVYWRNGQYALDAFFEACESEGCRVPWSGRKPIVWLAYPGEKPEINFNTGGRNGYIIFYDNVKNVYLDGFDFNINSNIRGKGIAIENNGNTTVRNNIFRGLTDCSHPGTNCSHLFFTGGNGQYSSVQDNVARESCGYWLLGYGSPKTVVENNHISTNIPLPISPKHGNEYWTIRANQIEGQTTSGAIYLQDFGYSSNIEVSFNLIQMSGSNGLAIKLISSDPGGPMYLYRNTIVGQISIMHLTSSKGPWTLVDNVVVNNSTAFDKLTRIGTIDNSRLIMANNLLGDVPDNIVDSQGYLTANYSNYVGSRGHQIGNRPMPPTALNVTSQ